MSDDENVVMHNKMKTNPIPIPNAFAPLVVLEDKSQNISGEQEREKENKPPPIYLHNRTNLNQFITNIKNLTLMILSMLQPKDIGK